MNPDFSMLDTNLRVESVKQEMNNFLGLLQKSISSSRDNILIETDSQYTNSQCSQQSKKLSVILSASEGASSEQQGRKQQIYDEDEISMNQFGSSSLEDNFIRPLIRKKTSDILEEYTPSTTGKLHDFEKSMLFQKNCKSQRFLEQCSRILEKKNQQQLLKYIQSMVKDYTSYILVLQKRNNENLLKKQKYRTKCEHLFRAFVTGREEEKRYQQAYIEQRSQIQKLQQIKAEIQLKWLKTSKELQLSKSESMYLKQLIMIANKNYQNLQKKYLQLQERMKSSELNMRQKQMHFIEGNSVLKDVIVNLQRERKSKSKERSIQNRNDTKQNKQNKQKSRERKESKQGKENKENKNMNKHKTSKSVPSQNKIYVEQHVNKKDEVDDAYRRIFLKTLKGT